MIQHVSLPVDKKVSARQRLRVIEGGAGRRQASALTQTPARAVPRRRHLRRSERFAQFLCVLPAVALILVLNYYAIFELIRISFTDWNMLKLDVHYVGLKNWKWLFNAAAQNRFLDSFWITIRYAIGNICISIGGGILLAVLFSRLSRFFSVLRAVVILPKYIAMSTSATVFLFLLNENFGIINQMLATVGLTPVKWLTNGNTAFISLLLLTGWHAIGYGMMIYLSAFQGISKEYYEAAKMDGATRLQLFTQITLPLSAPTTLFLFVTQFIAAMKVFQAVDVLTGGGPFYSTEVLVYHIYTLAFVDYRIDRASVVAVAFFLFVMLVTFATMKWSNRNVQYES
ncbi:MAG: sugar ABC transporter permease [Butyrivibrio sp.]|nr:sugar ABC transporter permease [Butyrivibrio sp.]